MSKRPTSPAPIKKIAPVAPVAMQDNSYQIVLTFNGKAELIDVNYPENFNVALANNHLAVASLFMAQQLVSKGE